MAHEAAGCGRLLLTIVPPRTCIAAEKVVGDVVGIIRFSDLVQLVLQACRRRRLKRSAPSGDPVGKLLAATQLFHLANLVDDALRETT